MVTITKQKFTFSELLFSEGEGLSIDADLEEIYQLYSKDDYDQALNITDSALDRVNRLHSLLHAARARLYELRAKQIEEEF